MPIGTESPDNQMSPLEPANVDCASNEESASVTEPLHDDYKTTESASRVEDFTEDEERADSTHEKR